MEKVSIIIPVFNVEPYLEQCVESCVQQEYKNIEVILIDDGSTDNSGMICDMLAKKHEIVKAFHKVNGGLSDARNCGIEKATGSYIFFVDSDDLIDRRIVSTLCRGIKSNECNIAICELAHFVDGEFPKYTYNDCFIYLNNEEALIEFLYQKRIATSACAKLYKKELLEKNRFVVGQRFEDNDFLFRVLLENGNVCLNQSALYAYRHRSGSITTSFFSEKEFDIIEIGKKIINLSSNLDIKIKEAARIYQLTNCFRIILTASSDYLVDDRYLFCKSYICEHAKEAFQNSNVRKKLKMGLLLYKVGFPIRLLLRIRNARNRWS